MDVACLKKLQPLVLLHRHDTTQRSGDAGIVDNRRLNEKSEAVAFKTVRERYAT